MLKADHAKVKKLFKEFERLSTRDRKRHRGDAMRICNEL